MTGECSHTYGLSRLNLRLFQRGAHRPTSESGIVFKTVETTKEKFVDLPLEEGLDADARRRDRQRDSHQLPSRRDRELHVHDRLPRLRVGTGVTLSSL